MDSRGSIRLLKPSLPWFAVHYAVCGVSRICSCAISDAVRANPVKYSARLASRASQPATVDRQRTDIDGAVGVEVDPVEASVGSTHLILCPDSLVQEGLFDKDGVVRERLFVADQPFESVQGQKQPNRES